MGKVEMQELLQKLVQAIISATSDCLPKDLQPDYLRYFRWKATEFEYDDTGIKKLSRQGEEFLKPFYSKASNVVFQKVSRLDIYSDTHRAVSEDYNLGEGQVNLYLHQLITRLAVNILTRKLKTVADTTKYIDSFLKDLNGEEQEYRSEVQLKGLILQPNSIQLDDNARLRKPERKDFEREVPIFFPSPGTMREDPTAFFLIRVNTTQGTIALQNEIDKEISILRLFRVGAVQDLQYTIDTDSVVAFAGGTIGRGKLLGPDKYLITNEDVEPLKKFWANMKKVKLPDSVYSASQKEPNEISIAYDRYNDSLEGSIIEKRISSAVMGLEALYLAGGEQQEMSYRLRLRVSKLLSLIDYNPNEVSERTQDAYEVRSKYVHGGILKQKDKQKLERKYGDINAFSKTIIDYLRASIVALLERPSKTSLIQKIDDSFLDGKKEEEIRELLFTS